MAILTSTVTEDRAQPGGRRYVSWRYTRDDGPDYTVGPYLEEAGVDVQAKMLARRAEIEAQLADEAVTRANSPILISIITKLAAFCQARTNLVLQASVASGGADLTLGERIIYRAITP